MRLHANLLRNFWAEAVNIACYLVNMSSLSANNFKQPQKVWTGGPIDLPNIRIFGCTAYSLVDVEKRSKLDDKSKKYIFIGFHSEVKGYKVAQPNIR